MMSLDSEAKAYAGSRNLSATCPACRDKGRRLLGYKSDYKLSQCLRCGTVFLSEKADGDALRELYDHYYDQARFEIPPVVTASYERLVRSSDPFRHTGRWLDVGYGEGGLLKVAENQGWSCYGVDIAPAALKYGDQRGWVVSADTEGNTRFPSQGFDVVTMIELLEHVPAPERFLRAAARCLRPGGLLYVTTPNAESLNRRLLGLEWSIFHPPEHLTIWTARGLCAALAIAGFQIQRTRTEGFNPCEIFARWRSRSEGTVAMDRNQTAFVLNSAFSSSPLRRSFKAGINRGLSAFRIGDSLKVWALRGHDFPIKG